jgi:hypothetical protein
MNSRHGLPTIRACDAIVLPAERDATIVGGDEASVRDGDAVRVAGQIAQHGLRSRERRLAVDDPFGVPDGAEEALEGAPVGQEPWSNLGEAWFPQSVERREPWLLLTDAVDRN